jgi:hypothetical protein
MSTENNSLLSERRQIFAVFFLVWVCLLAWSGSAFWAHLNSLEEEYQNAARLGALTGELVCLAFIWWHSFHKKMGVRKWSLILGGFLAILLVIHSGGVRGLRAARVQQQIFEVGFAQNASKIVKEGTVGAGEAAGKLLESGARRSDARQVARDIAAQVNKNATLQLREMSEKGQETVLSSTFLPRWYIDGWMYSGIFVLSILSLLWIAWIMLTDKRVDANFNGIPDSDETDDHLIEHEPISNNQPIYTRPSNMRAIERTFQLNADGSRTQVSGPPLTDEWAEVQNHKSSPGQERGN